MSAPTLFTTGTLPDLIELLQARQASIAGCADALRAEAADASRHLDLSDLHDHEDPCADSDAASVLILIQRAERGLREIEQALARVDDGTFGYCTVCGVAIPIERLRALPATPNCVACSGRSSDGTNGIGRDRFRQTRPSGDRQWRPGHRQGGQR